MVIIQCICNHPVVICSLLVAIYDIRYGCDTPLWLRRNDILMPGSMHGFQRGTVPESKIYRQVKEIIKVLTRKYMLV